MIVSVLFQLTRVLNIPQITQTRPGHLNVQLTDDLVRDSVFWTDDDTYLHTRYTTFHIILEYEVS